MKRLIFTFILAALCTAVYPQKAAHVVLISIDGLRPEFYKDKSWPTPNLQRLMAEGVYADAVRSVFPSVTYPSHTTIVTGAYPARHGIYYNGIMNSKNDAWYWEESLIKTKTLWDALKEAGMTSAAIMWPVSVGAPIDYNFPVRRANSDEKGDQLSMTRPYVSPSSLIEDYEKLNGKLNKEDFSHDNDQFDKTVGRLANYIIKTHKPKLTAVHYLGADHTQHDHGRDAPEVKRAVAVIDSMIGTLLDAVNDAGLKNNTAIIITGDHGHVDTETLFAPNIYLAKHHLVSNPQNWKAWFQPAGGGAFLYLKDKNDTQTLEQVKNILDGLPQNQKALFRVVERKELDKIGADPDAALALAMAKGAVALGDFQGEPLRKRKKDSSAHGHYPDFQEINTGFIAFGAGIKQKGRISIMNLTDIMPLVSRLLDLRFNAPDGKLVPGILKTK